jgi:chromosomal replication initiator protein
MSAAAQPCLPGFAAHRRPHTVTVARIQDEVAAYFGVSVRDLLSQHRAGGIVLPRHVAIFLAVAHTDHSYPAIGRFFGGRDHSTVMHAQRRIAAQAAADLTLAAQIRRIEARL